MSQTRGGRAGLGRGLSSLLPDAQAADGEGAQQIPIEAIRANPFQPRREFDEDALAELAASIEVHGVLQPISVRRAPRGEGFELIAGERRLRAARQAGLATIPALVRPATERELVELALVENLQREDLNAIESAVAYRRYLDEFGYTQEQLAERVGKSRTAVANTLRLLKLPPATQAALRAGQLSEGHGRALLGLPDGPTIEAATEKIIAQGLSVRATESLVRGEGRPAIVKEGQRRKLAAERAAAAAGEPSPAAEVPTDLLDADVADAAARLERRLGARVELRERHDGAGQITIYYHGGTDRNRLLEQLLDL